MSSYRRNNLYNSLYVLILSSIFLLDFVSSTLFIHTHIIKGESISHSHLYGGDKDSEGNPLHSHTQEELDFILYHNSLDYNAPDCIAYKNVLAIDKCHQDIFYYSFPYTYDTILHKGWRAPPYVLFV